MKIMVKRQYLLDQLPNGDIPEELILDGIPVQDDTDSIRSKYPSEYDVLSATQWAMFSEIAALRECPIFMLRKHIKYTPGCGNNGVSVHIYGVNKALASIKSSVRIKRTRRGLGGISGVYGLVTEQ